MKTIKKQFFDLKLNNNINEMFLLDSKLLTMLLMLTKIRLTTLVVKKIDSVNYKIIPIEYNINNILIDNMDFINIFNYEFFIKINY